MSGDQIPFIPGKKRGQMPGGGGGYQFQLRFDRYIKCASLAADERNSRFSPVML